MKLELIMPISAGLREDIAAYRGFIGQQYYKIILLTVFDCCIDAPHVWAKASHMWCGALTPMVRRAEYKGVNYRKRFYLLNLGSTSDVKK